MLDGAARGGPLFEGGHLMAKSKSHRLPTTIRPQKYALTLRPHLASFTFEGEEQVVLQISTPDKRIVLHANDLKVKEASVTLPNGTRLPAQIEHDEASQQLRLTFPREIPKGAATLSLTFAGNLNDQLA